MVVMTGSVYLSMRYPGKESHGVKLTGFLKDCCERKFRVCYHGNTNGLFTVNPG